jgi:hypothetical protein
MIQGDEEYGEEDELEDDLGARHGAVSGGRKGAFGGASACDR